MFRLPKRKLDCGGDVLSQRDRALGIFPHPPRRTLRLYPLARKGGLVLPHADAETPLSINNMHDYGDCSCRLSLVTSKKTNKETDTKTKQANKQTNTQTNTTNKHNKQTQQTNPASNNNQQPTNQPEQQTKKYNSNSNNMPAYPQVR